jgi:hypothetical protein
MQSQSINIHVGNQPGCKYCLNHENRVFGLNRMLLNLRETNAIIKRGYVDKLWLKRRLQSGVVCEILAIEQK